MRHAKCMSNTLQTSESHNKPSTSLPRHVSRPGENSLPQLTKWTHLQPLCRRARLLVVTNQQHFCCHLPASICQNTSEPPPPQPGATHGEEEPAAALHPTTRGPQSWTPPLLPRAFHGWALHYPSPFSGGQYREGLIGGLEIKTFPTWLEVLQRAAQHPSPEQLTQPRRLPTAENRG